MMCPVLRRSGETGRTMADVTRLAAAGRWDAVVDTSGPGPGHGGRRGRGAAAVVAGRYVYLSTVNAYTGWPDEPLTDDSPVYDAAPDVIAAKPGAAEGMAPALSTGS